MTKKEIYAKHWAEWANKTFTVDHEFTPADLSEEDEHTWIYEAMEEYANQPKGVVSEYQLCPKCLGDGNLARYNSPPISTNMAPVCDVCNGAKILIKPIVNDSKIEK